MPDRKFVACKFRSTDTRSFTYHHDGEEPLAIGDMVKVPDARSDGWKRVEVVSIGDEAPPFPTKAIVGKIEPEPAEDAALLPDGAAEQ
jgi:hypothetical protein